MRPRHENISLTSASAAWHSDLEDFESGAALNDGGRTLKMSSRRGSIKLEMHDEGGEDAGNKGLLNQFMKSDSDFSRVSQQEEFSCQMWFIKERKKEKKETSHKMLDEARVFFIKGTTHQVLKTLKKSLFDLFQDGGGGLFIPFLGSM